MICQRWSLYSTIIVLKEITISGTIKTETATGRLPESSCVTINLLDDSSAVVATESRSVSKVDISKGFKYNLACNKPAEKDLLRTYSVSVTVNVGWCAMKGSDKWIRARDYHATSLISFTKALNVYSMDVVLASYGNYFHFLLLVIYAR